MTEQVVPEKYSFLLLILLIFTSCQSDSVVNTQQESDVTAAPSSPTIKHPIEGYIERCVYAVSEQDVFMDIKGKLVEYRDQSTSFIVLPGLYREEIDLADQDVQFVLSSPSQEKALLFTWDDLTPNMVVIGSDGRKLFVSARDSSWHAVQWLNDDEIMIRLFDTDEFLIWNIVTGEQQSHQFPYYSELTYYSTGASRNKFFLYRNELDMVFYENEHHVFVLREVGGEPNHILWARWNQMSWAIPRWSSGGEKIAYVIGSAGHENLHILEVEGAPFDHLLVNIQAVGIAPRVPYYIDEIAWSPNDSVIALEISIGPDFTNGRQTGLVLVDSQTGEVVNYCQVGSTGANVSPVWSPDGKYLALGERIIELSTGAAWSVTDGVILGWLP